MFLQLLALLLIANAASNFQGGEGRNLSGKEELLIDIESQLKILNKPGVKSIHVGPHEIYDCVNIHEQPAFDNPLLKNHKLQIKPTHIPDGIQDQGQSIISGFEDEGCPTGTVPIRRTSKKDLINAKYLAKNHKPDYNIRIPKPKGSFVNHVATFSTNEGTFYGSSARFNIWNPVLTGSLQFSSVKMVFQGFRDDSTEPREVIEAGWAVYPALYDDNYTRITTSWTVDGYKLTGCYNLVCAAFVQVVQSIPLGGVLAPISTPGGTQGDMALRVYQDGQTRNWWLCVNLDRCIGYWPMEIFSILGKGRMVVTWGGETVRETSNPTSPPMGSGRNADAGAGFAAYISNVQLVKQDGGDLEHVAQEEVHPIVDAPQCYSLSGFDQSIPVAGSGFLLGGPGGNC